MQARHVIILTLALLLAGCAPGSSSGPKDVDYHKGKKGITIEFAEESPPPSVYEGSPFSARVRLDNEGAEDIPLEFTAVAGQDIVSVGVPGRLSLSYDDFYIQEDEQLADIEGNLDEKLRNITIKGRSELAPQGEEKAVTVGYLKAKTVKGQMESPETQLYASLCYPYRTRLSTDICMDAHAQGRNVREQVCEARDLTFPSGQGAPVTIEKVEVDMAPLSTITRPSFVIHVKNTGTGSVLTSFGSYENIEEACALRGSNTQGQNTVDVQADIAGVSLECEPNPLRLTREESKVFCRVPTQALSENRDLFGRQDNFVTTLNVNLGYYYTTSTSKTIEIERTSPRTDGGQYQGDQQECAPWETLQSGGACTNRCGFGDTQGMSCNCQYDGGQVVNSLGEPVPTDRYMLGEYCDPGSVCCKGVVCSDFDDDEESCISATDYRGDSCVYCETNDECTTSCNECEGENITRSGRICEEEGG